MTRTETLTVDLTDSQVKRLGNQKGVLLLPQQIDRGNVKICMRCSKANKIRRNAERSRGTRVVLEEGEGIREYLRAVGKKVRAGYNVLREQQKSSRKLWKKDKPALPPTATATATATTPLPMKTVPTPEQLRGRGGSWNTFVSHTNQTFHSPILDLFSMPQFK